MAFKLVYLKKNVDYLKEQVAILPVQSVEHHETNDDSAKKSHVGQHLKN